MIFILLGLEFTELETHFPKPVREKVRHQKRFSHLRHQPGLFPGKISRVRFSTTKAAVRGESRAARGDLETSARVPPVYEEAEVEAGRTPLVPCRDNQTMIVRAEAGAGPEEEPGTLAARIEARELRVNGK